MAGGKGGEAVPSTFATDLNDQLNMQSGLVPCISCNHDISWHDTFDAVIRDIAAKRDWEDGPCQLKDCTCAAFRHPKAPKRREAVMATRLKRGL